MSRASLPTAELQGLKYFGKAAKLLATLHEAGCQRDRAGNRQLHYDQYCLLLLLSMFSPLIKSLRALRQATECEKVQRQLGVKRVSYGSLAEAVQVFDPALLQPLVAQLSDELRLLACGRDPRLAEVRQLVTLVDSTMLVALPRIAAAAWGGQATPQREFAWRLHTHFEVLSVTVPRITLTGFKNAGAQSERQILLGQLASDRCYVMDRGYRARGVFNAIVAAHSSYVCRIQENTTLAVEREFPLSDAARAQGVVHDAVVQMGCDSRERPDHPTRVITLEVTPHKKRSGHKGDAGPGNNGLLLLVTNLLDVPAEIIALLYEYRWQIEIFFRFFKCVLGCGHLLSHHARGIQIQAYCALIACLLITLYSHRRPTRRTYEMLCWYFLDIATEEELLAHLQKLKPSTP